MKDSLLFTMKKYIDQVFKLTHDKSKAGRALAWNLFLLKGGEKAPLYDKVKRIMGEIVSKKFSFSEILSPEEINYLDRMAVPIMKERCYLFGVVSQGDLYSLGDSLSHLLIEFASLKPGDNVYLPFAGVGELAALLPENVNFSAEVSDDMAWAMTYMNLWVENPKKTEELVQIDSYRSITMKKNREEEYDCIITGFCFHPYYENPYSLDSSETVNAMYTLLSKKGRLVICVPASEVKDDEYTQSFQNLLDEKAVRYVISLPNGCAPIKNDDLCIFLITKEKNESVRFVDANYMDFSIISSGEMMFDYQNLVCECEGGGTVVDETGDILFGDNAVADIKTTEIKDANLFPKYYTSPRSEITGPSILIGDCIEELDKEYGIFYETIVPIDRFQLSKDYINCEIKLENYKITPSNYNSNGVGNHVNIPYSDEPELDWNIVAEPQKEWGKGNFVLSKPNKGEEALVVYVGIPCRVGKLVFEDSNVGANLKDNITPFRIKTDKILPEYILKVLTQDENLKKILYSKSTGSGNLCFKDLLDIRIPLLPLEEQNNIILEDIRKSLNSVQAKLVEAKEQHIRTIRGRKHLLDPRVKCLETNWKDLKKIIEKEMDLDKPINDTRYTPREIVESINDTISRISKLTSTLTNVKEQYGEAELWDPYLLILNICEKRHDNFNIEFPIEKNVKGKIKIAKLAMERVISNIFNNAIAHGFIDPNKTDYTIKFNVTSENGRIIISISNNGVKVAPVLKDRDLFEDGCSSNRGIDGHEGIGMGDIRTTLSHFEATVDLVNKPDDEFPVTYILSFEKYGN